METPLGEFPGELGIVIVILQGCLNQEGLGYLV